ncbi:winged helix-turn-helix domain-containing protein [Aestuariivirga sp.]|uniref:winged helix-turn-helix domain-containing protein n=1 Tax=Aestuariivirga sp. TaxID=2650926 RepID=UPI00391C9166
MDDPRYVFGRFEYDPRRRILLKDGMRIGIGPRALALLEILLNAGGKTVTKADLIEGAWKDAEIEESNLTVQIANLRKILGRSRSGSDWIVTVQRSGYQFNDPDQRVKSIHGDLPADPATTVKPLALAVLPFRNLSSDPEQKFFADGLTEDITTALGRLKGLLVIARTTMFGYENKVVDVIALGKELGVGYVLEGSVRKSGDQVRVTAQLIDATTGRHLWGNRYDSPLVKVFTVQDEISASVIASIGPELVVAEYVRASRKRSQNLDVWECNIRALFLSSRMSEETSRESLVLLNRALALDGRSALALGLKAWIVTWRAAQGFDDFQRAAADAKAASDEAIAADDSEPWAWAGQGSFHISTRQTAAAVAALSEATRLNPNFAMAHGLLGIAHAFGGQCAKAVSCIDYAARLSPREIFHGAIPQQYAFAHFQGADYAQGLECALRAHQLRPGHLYPMIIAVACSGHLGERASAEGMVARMKREYPHVTADWVGATVPYVLAEDRQRLTVGLQKAGME